MVFRYGINDADYAVEKKEYYINEKGEKKRRTVWKCPFYSKWQDMLRRVYSEDVKIRQPIYINSSVCEEWHLFSNFKSWMEKQDWEGKELDKDILFVGNKHYSPETCCFVPKEVNLFLTTDKSNKGKYKTGAYKIRDKFQAYIGVGGKVKFLGYFDTEDAAHNAWKSAKFIMAEGLIEKFNLSSDVAEAILARYQPPCDEEEKQNDLGISH